MAVLYLYHSAHMNATSAAMVPDAGSPAASILFVQALLAEMAGLLNTLSPYASPSFSPEAF